MRRFVLGVVVFLGGVFLPVLAQDAGAAISLEKCTLCHGKPDFRKLLIGGAIRDLFVTGDSLKGSVHEKKVCTDCHFDVNEIPHREAPQRVTCTHCHFKGNKEGAPQSDNVLAYFDSAHGKAIAAGNTKAPLCQDCHGSHQILKVKNPESTVSRFKVAETCGRCHMEIYAKYKTSDPRRRPLERDRGSALLHRLPRGAPHLRPHRPQVDRVPPTFPEQCSKCHSSDRHHGEVRHRDGAGGHL